MALQSAQLVTRPALLRNQLGRQGVASCKINFVLRSSCIVRTSRPAQFGASRQQGRQTCVPVAMSYSGNNGFGPVGNQYMLAVRIKMLTSLPLCFQTLQEVTLKSRSLGLVGEVVMLSIE